MGFTPLVDLENQEKENQKKNSALNALIFKNKANKDKLKDMQIVRFGNDLVVAIYRPQEQEGGEQLEEGSFGKIYSAYPITNSGKISDIELKIKIHKDTGRILDDSGEEILQLKAASTLYDEDDKTIEVSAVTAQSHAARNKAIVEETKADQTTFSARVTRIPRKEEVNGKTVTVYETATFMSTVTGVPLNLFKKLPTLTQEQRLRLAINVIKAYEDLHEKGKFHRDIKLENIMVHPETLQVTVIDRDNSVSTSLIRAPGDTGRSHYIPTPESEIYSLAQDVLPTILSGYRYLTSDDHLPNQIGPNIGSGINLRFSNYAIPRDKENPTSQKIKDILNKMRSADPNARGTLAEARAGLDAQLMVVTKNNPTPQDEKAIEDYQHSLRQLDVVLQSTDYKIPKEYWIEDKPNPIEDAYNSTVTETIFRLEQLAAEIISDSTEKTNEKGNKIPGKIPAEKVAEYNHHQRQLAILMKEKTFLSLQISEQNTATVVTRNTETTELVNVPAKQTKTTSIYFLAETLEHIRIKPKEPTTNLAKPTRIQSYSGNELELAEKSSLLKKFKKGFDTFFGQKAIDFCNGIRDIFKNISKYLSDVPEGKNPNAFFYHTQKGVVVASANDQEHKKAYVKK